MYQAVEKAAAGLKNLGIKKGDRIAGFIPNLPEAIIAMLASASIGAIWSSTSPDFGIKGVLDRFSQIEPKIIISSDGYYFKGKTFDIQNKLNDILHQLPTVEKVLLIDYTKGRDLTKVDQSMKWEDLLLLSNDELTFEQLPFNHPLYIMYSSGTTGLPKSIVHSAGGTLIQHQKELRLHCDLKPDDVIFIIQPVVG